MRKYAFIAVLILACVGIAETARAQSTADMPGNLPQLHVGKFEPVEQIGSGFGPLHALNADIHRLKGDENAARLSSALIEALNKHKISALKSPGGPPPKPCSGWIVQGIYYALDQNARLVSVPFVTSEKGPNVEVSVTISDCAGTPSVPFAVIGSQAAFKDRTPISWNPYIAAAKLVLNQAQGTDAVAKLAEQIAQKILEQGPELLAHAPGRS